MEEFALEGPHAPESWTQGRKRSRETMVEYVRDSLRNAILTGQLSGGSRLVQADIAAALEVSTTPVREAFRELVSEGLVRLDPHRGAVVSETSADELDEIYQMCRVLEPIAMREAVGRADGDLIRELRSLHERMLKAESVVEWMDLNRSFHSLIYDAASKPRLSAVIMNLRDARAMFIGPTLAKSPELVNKVHQHHTEIIEAIESRDPEAAVDAILHHLTFGMEVAHANQPGPAPSKEELLRPTPSE